MMDEDIQDTGGVAKIFNNTIIESEGKQYLEQQLALPTCEIHSESVCLERFLPPATGTEDTELREYIAPMGSNAPQQVALMENIHHLRENNFVNIDTVGNLTSSESDLVMEAIFAIFNVVSRG
jgi:hypothetical protein